VSYMPGVSTIFNVSFPEYRWQVLRGSSDCCHRSYATIIWFLKVVLRLPEINYFNLVGLGMKEHISRLHITVTDSYRL
jgi:hypothetical protein